jgi:hypothetical protein
MLTALWINYFVYGILPVRSMLFKNTGTQVSDNKES